jgi:Lrp/AsnC family leucine-responsive transcriptional regulator
MNPFDDIDRRILARLQDDARVSNAELARDLKMAPSAVFERVRKLEGRRLITAYEARLDPKALGLGLAAFVFVRAEESDGPSDTGRKLAALPEVQEVHQVAGEDCYLLKVRVRDTDDLARFLGERVKALPTIRGTRTTIVLGTMKESSKVPIEADKPERRAR